ncbi:MAG: hypothetical protein EB117_15045 [Betaproteobacteria bacterium]|nr:hypothetical protein [Betaproteobacteria bacterium]
MAKLVLLNASVTLNGTNISDDVAAVTLSTSAAEVPTTSFGSGGAVTRVAGLIDNSVTLSLHNEYSSLEGLIYPLIGSTAVTIVIKASTAAVSTANPSYTASVLVTEWTPINGAVGELNTADVTWPISGTITKATV